MGLRVSLNSCVLSGLWALPGFAMIKALGVLGVNEAFATILGNP